MESSAISVRDMSDETVYLTDDGRRQLRRRCLTLASDLEAISERMRSEGPEGADSDAYARTLYEMEETARLLARARDVADLPGTRAAIDIGDAVAVEDETGERETFLLVHPIEATFSDDRVSTDSPLGRALRGRQVGDALVVDAPGGSYHLTVVEHRSVPRR